MRFLFNQQSAIRSWFLKLFKSFTYGLAAGLGFFTEAILAVSVTGTVNTFTSGQIIKSADINTNFASLKTAIENIPDWTKSGANAVFSSGGVIVNTSAAANSATVTVNGRISSTTLGVYCGTYNGLGVGGYTGAKALCITACGNSNAHMCTAHEISISRQLGISVTNGPWYSSAAFYNTSSGTLNVTDCLGWTSASSSEVGPITNTPNGQNNLCNAFAPVACCL